jgi:hypothetical protein
MRDLYQDYGEAALKADKALRRSSSMQLLDIEIDETPSQFIVGLRFDPAAETPYDPSTKNFPRHLAEAR